MQLEYAVCVFLFYSAQFINLKAATVSVQLNIGMNACTVIVVAEPALISRFATVSKPVSPITRGVFIAGQNNSGSIKIDLVRGQLIIALAARVPTAEPCGLPFGWFRLVKLPIETLHLERHTCRCHGCCRTLL